MDLFRITAGEGPLVATAIHSGHSVRPAAAACLGLDNATRMREEDPYTDQLAELAPTHIVGNRSRFEFDLNRPREQAVYLSPEEAWGLEVWKCDVPATELNDSRANYDLFYATVSSLFATLIERYGRIVVLDLHSYNHRRDGAGGLAASEAENPEINIGTGSLDREHWGKLVDRFIGELRSSEVQGHNLDVRENVKFFGGHFPRWIHATFPGQACAIAVEFKKTFMDEWTGELDRQHFAALKSALRATFPGIHDELTRTQTT